MAQTQFATERAQSDLDFEVIQEDNEKVVYRKRLRYKASKEYMDRLPTVTLHSITDAQYNALQKAYDELIKNYLTEKKDKEKERSLFNRVLNALKIFVFE